MSVTNFADEFKSVKEFFEKYSDKLSREDVRNVMFTLAKIEIKCRHISEEDKKKSEEAKDAGNNYYKSQKLAESLDMYTKALELDPTNYLVYSNRSLVNTKLGRTQEAIQDCLLGIEVEPSFVKFYVRLAVMYAEIDKSAAQEYIEKGLKYEPDNKILLDMKEPASEDTYSSAMDSVLKNKALQDMVQNFVKDKSPDELKSMMSDVLGKLGKQNP